MTTSDRLAPELPAYVIDPRWWTKRPVLAAIRSWSRARLTPPEILLAHVLGEVALRIPTVVVLPPIVGGPAALNFGAVVTAETGVGKTSGGRALLGSAIGSRPTGEVWPLGTGEGIADFLLDDADGDGDRLPHGRPVLVHADEGRALEELVARSGSTLISVLCSAISGADLGQGNATKKLRRRVPALTYRLVVILNLQPIYLRGILADVDAGLPQRFLFVSGTGHHLADVVTNDAASTIDLPIVDTTDPVDKIDLPIVDVSQFETRVGNSRTIVVPEPIRTEIRRDHVARLHALDHGEPVAGGSHRNLLRLRVAALLAILDGRAAVTDDDWKLARTPVLASDATIERGAELRAEQARLVALADEHRAARHAVAASVAVETNAFDRLARKIARWVRAERGITRREIRRKLSPPATGILDDALEIATTKGWIVEHAEPSHTGDDRRVLLPGEVRP